MRRAMRMCRAARAIDRGYGCSSARARVRPRRDVVAATRAPCITTPSPISWRAQSCRRGLWGHRCLGSSAREAVILDRDYMHYRIVYSSHVSRLTSRLISQLSFRRIHSYRELLYSHHDTDTPERERETESPRGCRETHRGPRGRAQPQATRERGVISHNYIKRAPGHKDATPTIINYEFCNGINKIHGGRHVSQARTDGPLCTYTLVR